MVPLEEECPVCFGPADIQTRCCRKEVCRACLTTWSDRSGAEPTCPMCRQNPYQRPPVVDGGFLVVERVGARAPQGRSGVDPVAAVACVGSGIWGLAFMLWASRIIAQVI